MQDDTNSLYNFEIEQNKRLMIAGCRIKIWSLIVIFEQNNFSIIIKTNDMSSSYSSAKENKENQYHHEVSISPQKGRCNPVHYYRPNQHPSDIYRKGKEDDIISPTLLKTRKQLVQLWLNPVVTTLDTSLEKVVEDDEPCYQCSCLKEHMLL